MGPGPASWFWVRYAEAPDWLNGRCRNLKFELRLFLLFPAADALQHSLSTSVHTALTDFLLYVCVCVGGGDIGRSVEQEKTKRALF